MNIITINPKNLQQDENTLQQQEAYSPPYAIKQWQTDTAPSDGSRAPKITWPKLGTSTDLTHTVAEKTFNFMDMDSTSAGANAFTLESSLEERVTEIEAIAAFINPIDNSVNPYSPPKELKKAAQLTELNQKTLIKRIREAVGDIANFNYKATQNVGLAVLNNQEAIRGLEVALRSLTSEGYLTDKQCPLLLNLIAETRTDLNPNLFDPSFSTLSRINHYTIKYKKEFLKDLT